MAGKVGELYVELGLKVENLQKALGDVNKATADISKSLKNTGENLTDTGKQAGFFATQIGQISTAFIASIGVISIANRLWSGFKELMKDAVIGAMAEEKSENALRAALATTGREVEVSSGHYLRYSHVLHDSTRFTHEEVEAVQTLLIQLTHMNREGIDKATRGAIGLASVLGIDLHGAALMVTKAMEGNYQALARVGIRIKDDLPEQEKQNQLLDKLAGFYNRATAELNTFGGQTGQVQKNWNELKDTLGRGVIESQTLRGILFDVNEILKNLDKTLAISTKNWLDWVLQLPFIGLEIRTVGEGLAILRAKTALWVAESEKGAVNLKSFGDMAHKVGNAILPGVVTWIGNLVNAYTELHKEILPVNDDLEKGAIEKLGHKLKVAAMNAAELATTVGMVALNLTLLGDPVIKKVSVPWKGWITETENQLKALEGISKETSDRVVYDWRAAAEAIRSAWAKIFSQIEQATNTLFGAINELSRASGDRQVDDLEKSYEWRKKFILDSVMDEEKKADALKVLDAERESAIRQLQRQIAKDQKSLAIMEAIVNTAVGVTKCLATLAPPWSFIQAAVTAAAGAIQIATIKATPLPMAEGGILTRPTFTMMAEQGTEAAVPLDRAEEFGFGKGRSKPIILHNHIYVGGKEVKDEIVKIVETKAKRRELSLVGARV